MSSDISASLEDYLEALYHIIKKKHAAKAKDLVSYLKVTAASVTGALRVLSKKGLINYTPYDVITLTNEGASLARDVVRRHEVLKEFMTKILGIPDKEADEAACRMEHSVSSNVLEKLRMFIEFLEICPFSSNQWISKYRNRCYSENDIEICLNCSETLVESLKSVNLKQSPGCTKTLNLSNLPAETKAMVISIESTSGTKKRLAEMGIAKNSIIEIDRVAQPDKLIHITAMGFHVTLRADEAEAIMVQPLGLLAQKS